MKILMRNIGMTLHVIHKLRAQGIDNVKVNMDWQHLIMNGENLAGVRRAACRGGAARASARELRLGHVRRRQHGRRDGVHGDARARDRAAGAGYGENGERLGFDLYPYTEDAVGAVKRSVLQWNFIDGVAAKIDGPALREAQQAKDAVRAYGSSPRRPLGA